MTGGEPEPSAAAIHRATLYCETCGEETPHRILRVDRRRAAGAVSGVARCQVCRVTRTFSSVPEKSARVEAIVSSGPTSKRSPIFLPPTTVLARGDRIEVEGTPVLVTRLERTDGKTAASAPARSVATVWATSQVEPTVRVALIEGDRSRTLKVPASALPRLEVGATFRLGAGPLTIWALRANGKTWRRPGDAFPPERVTVVYARRTVRPPAGRSRWSTDRETPSSRASSSSTRARSRSSPGLTRTRRVPRARTAEAGATVQRSSSS